MSKLVLLVCIAVAGCARSSAIPLAADTVQINAYAAPVCGPDGAARIAARMAAVETIRHGFDRYLILDAHAQNNIGVAGYTTFYSGDSATTIPIVAGTHDQGLIVKMFKDGDPAGVNAISARSTLGPKWQEIAASNLSTCID